MPMFYQIGNAVSKPGTIQYGRLEAVPHPTGSADFFPVIIAQSHKDGPCLWLTTGIHGNEHAGPLVIHSLINQKLLDKMQGTIIAVPALNPAGLRTSRRKSYYDNTDPNRLWPDGRPEKKPDPNDRPPSALELAFCNLFDLIKKTADFLIDYHNLGINSISFAIRDRVLYRPPEGRSEAEARDLAGRLNAMVHAYGHTVITEFSASHYIASKMHRSVAGSVLLSAGIPAFTAELGTGLMPDPAIIKAACIGTRNVLRWASMLDDETEPVHGITLLKPSFPVRRLRYPYLQEACVVEHLVQPGDRITPGTPLAALRDIWGRPLPKDVLYSEQDGFILARSEGIYYYPGEFLYTAAVKDEFPLIGTYPKEYFDE